MPAPRLLLVTDRLATGGRPLLDVIVAALDAGLPAVQLREKDIPGRPLLALAERLRAETHARGAELWVNGRVDVAVAAGADVIHVGEDALPVDVVRAMIPEAMRVSRAVHDIAEVERSEADLLVFGPVWDTPSKRPFGAPQGVDRLRDAVGSARVPLLAIGGIDPIRAGDAVRAGATGVGVIRSILSATDPAAATRALLSAIRDAS